MSTLETNLIQPATGTTLTVGASGDQITAATGVKTSFLYPAFEAYLSATQTITHDTTTKVAFNTEVYDTDSAFDTSAYKFTPQVAGKYFTYGNVTALAAIEELKRFSLYIYKNGSTHKVSSFYFNNNEARYADIFIGTGIDMNGSSDYLEMYVKLEYASTGTLQVNGTQGRSGFGAYRIGT